MGGFRSNGSWRYRIIKGYRRRARKFQSESKTPEEFIAWGKVIEWLNSILEKRCLNMKDAISITLKSAKEALEEIEGIEE